MGENEPQNCWEFINCPKETCVKCPAYIYKEGKNCWLIASSFRGDGCPKTKGTGMMYCIKECAWFKKLNPDT